MFLRFLVFCVIVSLLLTSSFYLFYLSELTASLFFLLIGGYFFGKICFKQLKQKRHALEFKSKIPDPFIITLTTIWFGIVAARNLFSNITSGTEHAFEWTFSIMIIGLFLYLFQDKEIYTNGISTRGNFYKWEDIESIIVNKKSPEFIICLKNKSGLRSKQVRVSVKHEEYEKTIEKLKEDVMINT
ncbi:hypothetical protein PRVXH_001584 [Proteinivorax hydrogeniformans]|uniref:DUF5673 domain-containing protein n=1 Tax=Proteinivorax hydrogeniformans TaxID=1826727 RepID=A0AAU8HPU6_9FIRM